MRQVHVVWVAIGLLALTLLFPPYGYTRYTVTIFLLGDVKESGESHYVVPWTYVRHGFILSRPPDFAPELYRRIHSNDDGQITHSVEVNNMAIAWPILAIQAGIICLVAGGVFYTLRRRGRVP